MCFYGLGGSNDVPANSDINTHMLTYKWLVLHINIRPVVFDKHLFIDSNGLTFRVIADMVPVTVSNRWSLVRWKCQLLVFKHMLTFCRP